MSAPEILICECGQAYCDDCTPAPCGHFTLCPACADGMTPCPECADDRNDERAADIAASHGEDWW